MYRTEQRGTAPDRASQELQEEAWAGSTEINARTVQQSTAKSWGSEAQITITFREQ